MRVTIATLLFGELSYFGYTEALNRRYCELHHYRFEIIRPKEQIERSPIWFKVQGARELLVDCDYLMFLDADAYFIDYRQSIEAFANLHMGNAALVLGSDRRDKTMGWSDVDANCGVFLLRNCREAFEILTAWWESPLRDKKRLWAWPPEQGAFNTHIRTGPYSPWIKVIDYSYLNGTDGTFIRHLIGYSDEQRLNVLRQEVSCPIAAT